VDLEIIYCEFLGGFERVEDKVLVVEKEKRKMDMLKKEEETWRQRNRVNWLASRDRNTKKIHSYANFRIHINTIWDIRKVDGSITTIQKDLEKEVVGYFPNIFKEHEHLFIVQQLEVIQTYPRIF
jgi:hypothetical protein